MKTKLTYLLLLASLSFSYGQIDTTYHRQVLKTSKDIQQKLTSIDSLISYQSKIRHYKDVGRYIELVELYLDEALKEEEKVIAAKKLCDLTIAPYVMTGNVDKYYKLLEKLEQHNKTTVFPKEDVRTSKAKDEEFLWRFNYLKGGYYANTSNYTEAIKFYNLSIVSIDKTTIEYAKALGNIGVCNYYLGNYAEAFKSLKESSKLFWNLNYKIEYYRTISGMLDFYVFFGLYKDAVKERQKLIDQKVNDSVFLGLAYDYAFQAMAYEKLKDPKKQEESLIKGLKYLPHEADYGRNFIEMLLYTNYTSLYAPIDHKKAKKYVERLRELSRNLDHKYIYYMNYEIAEASYLYYSGEKDKALELYLSILDNAEKQKRFREVSIVSEKISEIYESRNNIKKALKYLKFHERVEDSVTSTQKANVLSYYQTLYAGEKKELEILKQKEAIHDLEDDAKIRERAMLVGSIGLTLLFVIIFLLRNRRYLRRKNNLQAKFSQNLLLSQELERRRIAKELHDSLGQKLLIVKNQIPKELVKVRESLDSSIDEMRVISRALNPLKLKELGITSAIKGLVRDLDENCDDTYFFEDVENIDGMLSKEKELSLYRIIQECFSNVMKHAKASSAKLEIKKEESKIIITIQDNGIGFDFTKNFNKSKSLGLKTIEERVRFLNGNLKVTSKKGKGAFLKIAI